MNIDHIKPGQFIEVTKAELDAIHKKTLDDYERLVAAAPELLDALRGFVTHGTCFDDEDMAKARAAIAKATGGAE
jgi:hypothetical protein